MVSSYNLVELMVSVRKLTAISCFYWCIRVLLLYLLVFKVRCLSILEHTIDPPVASNCSSVTLSCRLDTGAPDVEVWWMFRGENASQLPASAIVTKNAENGVWQLELKCPTLENNGRYDCNAHARNESEIIYRKEAFLKIYVPVTIQLNHSITRQRLGGEVNLSCAVTGHPLPAVKWYKDNQLIDANSSKFHIYVQNVDSVSQLASLRVYNLMKDNNGTYLCHAENEFNNVTAPQDLLVEEPPVIEFLKDTTVIKNSSTALLNWHVIFDGNSPIGRFHLDRNSPDSINGTIFAVDHDINGNVTQHAVQNLLPGFTYMFRISAVNSVGNSAYAYMNVSMPADVPPKVSWVHLLGSTSQKLMFGWKPPSHDNGANITHYVIELHKKDGNLLIKDEFGVDETDKNKNIYTFIVLDPGETYYFQIQACNAIGCGLLSEPVEATTSDGIADPPRNVLVTCDHDFIEGKDTLTVTWEAPVKAQGSILSYNVTLYSRLKYRNENGQIVEDKASRTEIIDVAVKRMEYKTTVSPNTQYTARMCTTNKSGCSPMTNITEKTQCKSLTNVPSSLPEFKIKKKNCLNVYGQLELNLKRVNERNASILCYKIIMIKLPKGQNMSLLPSDPETFKLYDFDRVDKEEGYNVYVAEAFTSSDFVNEVVIGDNHQRNSCNNTWSFNKKMHEIQNFEENKDAFEIDIIQDGTLSPNSNYTGYVLIEFQGPNDTVLTKSSPYFSPILIETSPTIATTENLIFVTLKVLSGVILGILLISFVMLSIRHVYRPNYFENVESSGFAALILRSICRGGNLKSKVRRPSKVPRLDPITAEDLPVTFVERHADGDLIFQSEFEALPDIFKDRTTVATDAPENLNKNRYPDIKAYDQTRVKLPQIESIPGSDYVNANLVEGYKGNKTFFCAQSPLESTVTDFWRMIWEYRVTVIVMLTDIEEHGQVKCAQYWNDNCPIEIETIFSVAVMNIKHYSDYIVRKLQVKNRIDGFKEAREVLHFHFVLWKDFLTPEQPSCLVRFIQRVNEHYSSDRGPLLVHCSSGVGCTGTFVAIDNLLQQLEEEGRVDVFSQVSNLRRQRNCLVHSLNEYIFVYRVLTEHVMFGDTEVDVWHLREHYELLRETNFGYDKTRLSLEFENLMSVIEDPKTFCVGTMDINAGKNRYNFISPYDFNRVILPPLSSSDGQDSYLNASFILGYDRSLLFIITQDPLTSTIFEFWRMIREQNITSLVMLSEIGEGRTKCQQYWPAREELEKVCNSITVTLESSEEFLFYIKRKFSVMDTNSVDNHTVTQFQLREWPLSADTFPVSTLGLVTLIEDVQQNQEVQAESGPITVHCSGGGDRSSVFVALSSLLLQLKVGEKVDVFQTAKYTRLQRHCMLQTLPLYDLLYRGLLEYINSRNMCDFGDTQL